MVLLVSILVSVLGGLHTSSFHLRILKQVETKNLRRRFMDFRPIINTRARKYLKISRLRYNYQLVTGLEVEL